jgi:hypothetical protein
MSIINLTLNELKPYKEVEIEDTFIETGKIFNRKFGCIYIDFESYTIYDSEYNKIDEKYLNILEEGYSDLPCGFEIKEEYTLNDDKCYIVSKKTYKNENLNNEYNFLSYETMEETEEYIDEISDNLDDLSDKVNNLEETTNNSISDLNETSTNTIVRIEGIEDDIVDLKTYTDGKISDVNERINNTNEVISGFFEQKIVSGTTGDNQGDTTTVAHGLTGDNIIGIQCVVRNTTNYGVIPSTSRANYEYEVRYDDTNIILELISDNSDYLTGKPFDVLITYK